MWDDEMDYECSSARGLLELEPREVYSSVLARIDRRLGLA